jgi:hypothetical protein
MGGGVAGACASPIARGLVRSLNQTGWCCVTGTWTGQRGGWLVARWVVQAVVQAVVAVGGAFQDDPAGRERERSSAAPLEKGELVVYAVAGDAVHELA